MGWCHEGGRDAASERESDGHDARGGRSGGDHVAAKWVYGERLLSAVAGEDDAPLHGNDSVDAHVVGRSGIRRRHRDRLCL